MIEKSPRCSNLEFPQNCEKFGRVFIKQTLKKLSFLRTIFPEFFNEKKPSFKYLRQVYSQFDRKFKKNIKKLIIVHPTTWMKTIWTLFKPLISSKFGQKITYVNYLRHMLYPEFNFYVKFTKNGKKNLVLFLSSIRQTVLIFS